MANKIHDAFENVKADPELKKSTIQYLAEKRRRKMPFFPYLPVRRTMLAVACMFVLIMGISGYSWVLTPVSYVSIDVNPSVELALNRLNRVVSATAYNAQGEELLEQLSLRGKKYTQALHIITESDLMRQYLQAEEELVITVAADKSKERVLKAGAEKCCGHIGHGSRSVSVNLQVAEEAHGNGLSVGKYSAYLELTQYDDSVTVDECKDMSMTEIHGRILEHTHGNGHGAEHETENTAGAHEDTDEEHDAQAEDTAKEHDAETEDTAKEHDAETEDTAKEHDAETEGTAKEHDAEAEGMAGGHAAAGETESHGNRHRRQHGSGHE